MFPIMKPVLQKGKMILRWNEESKQSNLLKEWILMLLGERDGAYEY